MRAANAWPWKFYRGYMRAGKRLTRWAMRHFRVTTLVLDTNAPNVPFLKVKHLVVVNGYGQERVIREGLR